MSRELTPTEMALTKIIIRERWRSLSPFRFGLVLGEIGLEVEPWWPSPRARQSYQDGLAHARRIRRNRSSKREG